MFATLAFAQDAGTDAVVLPPATNAGAAHEGTVAAEGAHETGFPPFNSEYYPSQILWLAITFGIFYFVLKRTILPRIAGILENRRDRIALDLEAAERMKTDADEAQAAYQQELAEARDRAHKIAHDARESAREDAGKERKRLDADLNKKLDEAQTRIAGVKNEALKEVGQIAEETTDVILREVARVEASREEIAAAVNAAKA